MPVGDLRIKVSVFGAGLVVAGLAVGVFLVVLVWVDRDLRGGENQLVDQDGNLGDLLRYLVASCLELGGVEGGRFENRERFAAGVGLDAFSECVGEGLLDVGVGDVGCGAWDFAAFVFVIAAPDAAFVLGVRVPGFAAEGSSAVAAVDHLGEWVCA